ncbi:MAG TPA: Uma2 family endonuclease, partial [Polyangiaceae bacterium]|nr:Uma2 family endonuclease [Polyangiaceae bacterium]
PTMQPQAVVSLRYPVRPDLEAWVLPEGKVPEATAHYTAVYRIYGLLLAWSERIRPERSVRIASDLAIRWLEQHPRTGADPDISVLEPAPPDFDDLRSLKLWEPGRVPPRLGIEVVSASLPHKDYGSIQERYAAMGVEELIVFDPLMHGPRSLGGPVALQLWRRDATFAFERVQFGAEPVYSKVVDAWFIAEGRDLQISPDRRGTQRWLTADEQLAGAQTAAQRAHADAERANADAERERQARQELERRVKELESKLQG